MTGIDNLIRGFGAWCEGRSDGTADSDNPGQAKPDVLILACSDLHPGPQQLTWAGPGELLVIQNVAGLIAPHGVAPGPDGPQGAVEYAVQGLGVRHIVALGHAGCSCLRHMLDFGSGDGAEPVAQGQVPGWMSVAVPALVTALRRDVADIARPGLCEQDCVRLTLENLMTHPAVYAGVENGVLSLHGWHVDTGAGRLSSLDPASDEFRIVYPD